MDRKSKLKSQLEKVKDEIDHLNENGDPTNVQTSIESCGLQAKMWRILSQIRIEEGNQGGASDAARRAVDFEKQIAAAAKSKLADRVKALEDMREGRNDHVRSLRNLRVVREAG